MAQHYSIYQLREPGKNMRLILFTAHYPYKGETFLADELRVAKDYFDEIVIVTTERRPSREKQYLPEHSSVIEVCKGTTRASLVMQILPCLVTLRFWREVTLLRRTTKDKILRIIRAILLQESQVLSIRRKEYLWDKSIDNHTILYAYWLSGAASYLSRLSKQNLRIARTHGGDCFFDRGIHPYRTETLNALDRIYPISDAGREDLLTHYSSCCNDLESKIKTMRLGVRLRLEGPKEEQLEHRKGVKTIVSCSNIIKLKRLDLIVLALDALSDRIMGPIKWIHIGEGVERKKIESLAERHLHEKESISYEFKGHLANEEVLQYYENHGITAFVNCSDAEGIPVSAMEAMSFGIPVIARNVGGNSELVDESCGILLEKQIEAEDLANAIIRILSMQDDQYRSLCMSAYNRIKSSYNSYKNYHEMFSSLCDMDNER